VVPPLLTPETHGLAGAPFAQPGPCHVPFATDGGNLARLGLEPVVWGPGRIDVAHKADEYVAYSALERTQHILSRLIRARCLAP